MFDATVTSKGNSSSTIENMTSLFEWYLKARTVSRDATHPAWISRTSELPRRALISEMRVGQAPLDTSHMIMFFKVTASCDLIPRLVQNAIRRRMEERRAILSESGIAACPGLRMGARS